MKNTFRQLKVIDLSTVLAGPSVGSFFAELGASVIKIENPNRPDVTRSWKLPSEDKNSPISAYFSSINYKKDYSSLDLRKKKDLLELYELVKTADIVLMNFKRGDQKKLNITDEILRLFNPQLIIGKISGFGNESDRVAYDLILQAESGIMSMNGEKESNPTKMPIAFIDVLAAHHLKEGILIELIKKSQNENYIGKTISVSLYDAAICSLVNQASNYLMEKHVPKRIGSLHPNIAPYGELFKTSDYKTITFAIGSNKHFEYLCKFLKMANLSKEDRFSSTQNRVKNRAELFQLLQNEIQKYPCEEILTYMHDNFVPCGEIKDLDSVFKTEESQRLVRTEMIENQMTKRVTGIAFQVK